MKNILENWKSTVSNILTLVIMTGGYFAMIPTTTLQQNGITQHVVFWGTVVCGLAKVYVGFISKDAK